MSDLPDDLSSGGTHSGNEAPTETNQTVRCPEGPDPRTNTAEPASALYQLVRPSSEDRLQIRVHPPRAQVFADDETEELGQYRTVDALREALNDVPVDGWTGVFEEAEADRVLTDDVSADHPWIGQPRYETITLFAAEEDAAAYAEASASTRT